MGRPISSVRGMGIKVQFANRNCSRGKRSQEQVVSRQVYRQLRHERCGLRRSMPFTVSHVAAALPLRRMRLIWSAFVIGSMAPDFPYLFGNTTWLQFSHAFPGVLLLTFPGSLAALWLFHIAIKRPVVGLLPAGFQVRLRQHLGVFPFGGATRFSAIALSVTVGLATHIGWDAFTHPFTWPWRRWAWLRSWIHVPLAGETEMYVVLQYVSTVGRDGCTRGVDRVVVSQNGSNC